MSDTMQKELDRCKDCAEYGSEFCEDCLKEQLEQQELQRKTQDLTTKKEEAINNS